MAVVHYLIDGKTLAPDETIEMSYASVPMEHQIGENRWYVSEAAYPSLRIPRLGATFHIMSDSQNPDGSYDAFEVTHGNWFKIKVY